MTSGGSNDGTKHSDNSNWQPQCMQQFCVCVCGWLFLQAAYRALRREMVRKEFKPSIKQSDQIAFVHERTFNRAAHLNASLCCVSGAVVYSNLYFDFRQPQTNRGGGSPMKFPTIHFGFGGL